MKYELLRLAAQLNKENGRKNLWRKVVSCMAGIVVFCTTYALILPAITMEREAFCGYVEHIHTDECYGPSYLASPSGFYCIAEEDCIHTHQDICYAKDGTLICHLPELKEHVHTDKCYESSKNLICGLEETGHTHHDSCYVFHRGALICELEESEAKASPSNAKKASPSDADGPGSEQESPHVHGDDCYEWTKELICTKEEAEGHMHTDSCYESERRFICELDEIVPHMHDDSCYEDGELICDFPEIEKHQHTEECLIPPDGEWDLDQELVLLCGLEEHVHDESCYHRILPATPSNWQPLPEKLSGNRAEDVVAVAESQIGYEESTDYYELGDDGEKKGYTCYGDWYGDPYGDWCAMFVSFCLHFAQVDDMPLHANCQVWIDDLKEDNLFADAADYIPHPGDLIFFNYDDDSDADHVGIVERMSDRVVKTIEGNSDDSVARNEYDIADDTILGYGILPSAELPIITRTASIYTDDSYQNLSDDATVITLTGGIPEQAEIRAFPAMVETEQQVLCAYDITIFLPDGTLFEPGENEQITVTIQSPEWNVQTLGENQEMRIYYVPEEGDPEFMNSSVTEEEISFDTNHFSVYMVMAVETNMVNTAEELKAAINNKNSIIRIGANFEISESIDVPANADITLELNGHTITHSGSKSASVSDNTLAMFVVQEGAALTIIDNRPETQLKRCMAHFMEILLRYQIIL